MSVKTSILLEEYGLYELGRIICKRNFEAIAFIRGEREIEQGSMTVKDRAGPTGPAVHGGKKEACTRAERSGNKEEHEGDDTATPPLSKERDSIHFPSTSPIGKRPAVPSAQIALSYKASAKGGGVMKLPVVMARVL